MISVAYAAAEHAAEHAGEAGPFYTDPHFWVYVSFVVVVGFLFKPVFVAATKALDNRAAEIKARLDEAQKLREEAAATLALYQRKQQEANKEAESIIARAHAEAEAMAEQSAADLVAFLTRREKQALEHIAQAEAQAQQEVRTAVVDVAIETARTVISHHLGQGAAPRVVDETISELAAKFH